MPLWFSAAALIHLFALEKHHTPSGMELLFGNRLPLSAEHEPSILVGLAEGQSQVQLKVHSSTILDYYEKGTLKREILTNGDSLQVAIVESQPAQLQPYVQITSLPWSKKDKIIAEKKRWQKKGLSNLQFLETGVTLGFRGYTMDTRTIALIHTTKHQSAATKLSQTLLQKHNHRTTRGQRLIKHPSGYLRVRKNGQVHATATSYIRLTPTVAKAAALSFIPLANKKTNKKTNKNKSTNINTFRGTIYITVDRHGKLATVNQLNSEAILRGVVPAELFASAPKEALKAQAIAARTILLSHLGHRHHSDPYHLCNKQHCQVYGGFSREQISTNQAIAQTRGTVLFHGRHLVDALYSSTCGGHTEDNESVWNTPPHPALRGRLDFRPNPGQELFTHRLHEEKVLRQWIKHPPKNAFCLNSRFAQPALFRWERVLSQADLKQHLNKRYPKLGTIASMRVIERGRAGKVKKLEIIDINKVRQTISLELPIRRSFGHLPSGTFVLDLEKSETNQLQSVRFQGAGWGHGVGMCQMGAIGRATAGQSFEQILSHYYRNSNLNKLYD